MSGFYLAGLRAEGREIAEIEFPVGYSEVAIQAGADATVAAMRAGAEVIYQGTFFDGKQRGHTDFLFRVKRASDEEASRASTSTEPKGVESRPYLSHLLATSTSPK